jgi:cob(I)alamin adenosyltransferase
MNTHYKDTLAEIQDRLFTIRPYWRHLKKKEVKKRRTSLKNLGILETDIELLENEIDSMENELPEMTHFVLPGGHTTVSHCHIARCVCRRAERCCTFKPQ